LVLTTPLAGSSATVSAPRAPTFLWDRQGGHETVPVAAVDRLDELHDLTDR
jgi:hypothetical protein